MKTALHRIAIMATMAAVTSVGWVAVGQPAQAASCNTDIDYGYDGHYKVHCNSGPGIEYRAVAVCRNAPNGSWFHKVTGRWVHEGPDVNHYSVAICDGATDFPYLASADTDWR
jgi:hypothetical protein